MQTHWKWFTLLWVYVANNPNFVYTWKCRKSIRWKIGLHSEIYINDCSDDDGNGSDSNDGVSISNHNAQQQLYRKREKNSNLELWLQIYICTCARLLFARILWLKDWKNESQIFLFPIRRSTVRWNTVGISWSKEKTLLQFFSRFYCWKFHHQQKKTLFKKLQSNLYLPGNSK